MRIIAGKFRGRKLVDSTSFRDLRPTSDRNRETLFNILTAGNFLSKINFNLLNSDVLDLCCGTGAVGFESLSRGAHSLTLIDNNQQHLTIAKQNAELLGVVNNCEFIKSCATNLPICNKKFDLIFLDPPYRQNYQIIIDELFKKKYLEANVLLVIEHSKIENNIDKEVKNLNEFKLKKHEKKFDNFIQNLIDNSNLPVEKFSLEKFSLENFSLENLATKKSGSTIFEFLKVIKI